MRGTDQQTDQLISSGSPEMMMPQYIPLRVIRPPADAALDYLSLNFDEKYSTMGCPSSPLEQLLRALLLQAFFSVRPEGGS
jgi:hypothetical protein